MFITVATCLIISWLGNHILLFIIVIIFRKHALNCHRMKPALFNVLCEIKEKTGEFCSLVYPLLSVVFYFVLFTFTFDSDANY